MSLRAYTKPRSAAARARRSVVLNATVGAAVATLACGALPAKGETGPSSEPSRASCPSPNPPNELALSAGTPQTAKLGDAFATNLQVAFTNSDDCPVTTPVAGIPVGFSAPSSGASGVFSASGSNAVRVGSDASGVAVAPIFTANGAKGSYRVTASSAYGSVSFSLTNVEADDTGVCGATPSTGNSPTSPAVRPTKLTVGIGARQSTPKGRRFPIRLAVTVTDADRGPVPGVPVTFAAPSRGPSGRFRVRSGRAHSRISHPSRSRMSRARRVTVRSDTCGVALAPVFTANDRAGGYVVVASVEGAKAAFALVNEGG